MKNFSLFLSFCLLLLLLGCSKEENFDTSESELISSTEQVQLRGAVQISGTGVFADNTTCDSLLKGLILPYT